MNELFGNLFDEGDRGAGGRLHGLAVGVVTDNVDPEGLARVRIRLPWQEDGAPTYWARCAVLMAGPAMGTFFLPEVDDEVLVGAENDDPSHLYVLGMLWNGKRAPPEKNKDGKNDKRLIKSRSGHQLLFDDGDKPVVELKLKDGKRLTMDDDGVVVDDDKGNVLTIATKSGEITIKSKASLTLKSQKIAIEAGATMEIKASGSLKIQGALVQIN